MAQCKVGYKLGGTWVYCRLEKGHGEDPTSLTAIERAHIGTLPLAPQHTLLLWGEGGELKTAIDQLIGQLGGH
jgi:hypothetical protein